VAAQPVLGLPALRETLLDNLSVTAGRRSGRTGSQSRRLRVNPTLQDDDEVLDDEEFDEDEDADKDDDDDDSDDEEEEETWQV
jgi:hypothetical protein